MASDNSYAENYSKVIELPGTGGINALDDPEFIGDNELEFGNNVIFSNGLMTPRQGSYLFAAKPTGETNAGVEMMDPKTSDGVNFLVVKYGTNYYMWDNINSQWININGDGAYAPSHTDTDGWTTWDGGYGADVIYGGNGKDDDFMWQMCLSTLSVTTANGDGTVTLADASRFPTNGSSGVLLIQDGSTLRSYTISSVSGNVITISGTVGHVIASGASVTVGMVDKSSMPKGRVFTTSAGRLIIANKYQAESLVKWSVVGTQEDFSTLTGPNGAGSRSVNDEGGEIRAMIDFGAFVAVCKDGKILQFTIVISSDLSSNYGSFQPAADGESIGPVARYTAVKALNSLWYPTASQGLTNLQPTSTGTSFSITADTKFSEKVLPLCIGTYSFLNARSKYYQQKFYFAAGIPSVGYTTSPNSVSVKNTDILVYDSTFQAWSIFKGWSVQDFAVYNQSLLYLSNTDGQIYQTNVGYDDNGQGYLVDAGTKHYNFDNPVMPKTCNYIPVRGAINKGGKMFIDVIFETAGGTQTQTYKITSDMTASDGTPLVSFPTVIPLGGNVNIGGDMPLGGGVPTEDVTSDTIIKGTFNLWLDVSVAIGALAVQLNPYSEQAGTYWELKVCGFDPKMENAHPVGYTISPSN